MISALFHVDMSRDLWKVLKHLKYQQRVFRMYIKDKKTFHPARNPFVSQWTLGAYFFKNPEVLRGFEFPAVDPTNVFKEETIEARRNWRFVAMPRGEKDEQGKKVLECPQDPDIPREGLRQVVKHFGPRSCYAALGDGQGYGAIAALGFPINVLITERNARHWEALVNRYVFEIKLLSRVYFFRLQDILGYQSVVRNMDELKYPKYLKFWEEWKASGGKEGAAMASEVDLEAGEKETGGRRKLIDLLDARFPELKAEVKEKIVNLVITAEQASDQEVSELAEEVLNPLAPGLTTHYVSVAGTIYRLPTSVWQEVESTVGPAGIVSFKKFHSCFV
jgi:hypothetical protein